MHAKNFLKIDDMTRLLAFPFLAVSPPAKVLVTGANGYLATWVSAFLNDKFSHYGDRFELVFVEDITKDGAFDDAVKGVDTIAHIASPFHYKSTNPAGTTSILNSVLKHGNTLKRVILTYSGVAALEVTTPSLGPAPTVDDINTSQREVYDTLTGALTGHDQKVDQTGSTWLSLQAARRPFKFFCQDLLNVAMELGIPNVPRGESDLTEDVPLNMNFETTRAEDLLGLTQVTPLKDMSGGGIG
ncbi:hypothetical protein F5888DRAFT_1812399 [Russula emetica]|nr:hypothetical protein F5888DRAFT_1812399 [Russula emetica]